MRTPTMICGVPRVDYMRRYFVALEKLRRFEGDTVELVADDGEHESKVICCGGWTRQHVPRGQFYVGNYFPEEFTGTNILLALENAAKVWRKRYREISDGRFDNRLGDWDVI